MAPTFIAVGTRRLRARTSRQRRGKPAAYVLVTARRVFYAFGLSFSLGRAASMSDAPTIRSPHLDAVEVAWFSALPSGYVLAKINRYIKMGMRAFIFSGYPHIEECERFARHVLPQLRTCRLAP
ncbi:MAG: hypothetical protein IID44_28480 [Planctomycetes bacterium]|nr:hypothetical protein [Planctomycetota bacterium]